MQKANTLITMMGLLLCSAAALSQPRYDYDKLSTEQLDRGLVAVRQADGKVFISWRILRDDRQAQPFDVYRDGQKLNAQPLTQGGSWFIDEDAPKTAAVYEVRTPSPSGSGASAD